jgi:hypothetical protein
MAACHHLSRGHQYAVFASSKLKAYIDNDACGIDCYEGLSDVRLLRKGCEVSYHGICDEPRRACGVAEYSCAG